MAITATGLAAAGATADVSSRSTPSVTPTANSLILAAIQNTKALNADLPTCSGNGLTWVEVATILDTVTDHRLTIFRAMGASPSAGAITFDFGGNTQTGTCYGVVEFAGVDTGGTNGSAAVRQPTTGEDAVGGTSLTITLGAFADAGNATYGAFGHAVNQTSTVGSGFTALFNNNHGTPASGLIGEFLASNDTSVDASWATSAHSWGIALEIVAAPAAGLVTPKPLIVPSFAVHRAANW